MFKGRKKFMYTNYLAWKNCCTTLSDMAFRKLIKFDSYNTLTEVITRKTFHIICVTLGTFFGMRNL